MQKSTIAFFETEPWEKNYLESKLQNFDLNFFEEKLHAQNCKYAANAHIISPFIYSTLDTDSLNTLPSLRYITTRSTGFDHIDLPTCQQKNILVSNVPTYGENTVAEHAFALILALSRKICLSWERTRQGNFSLEGLRGFDLRGKTLGVVGTGNIGQKVIEIAKGFGMEVLAFDIKERAELASELHFQYAPLEHVFQNSDIITLHVAHNNATHHLVNLENLRLFKKGCYLINTARGGICDTTALLKGLELGIFAGLGIDTLEEECFIKEEKELLSDVFQKTCDLRTVLENHMLIKQPNVIVTPHNAFNSQEALSRILDTTIENIQAFSQGAPVNLVKPNS